MSRAQLTSTVEQNTGGAVAPFVAGKNKIINGDFGVWQRGTSITLSYGSYSADRWQHLFDGSGATRTVTQQTFTPGAAPVAGYEGATFFRFNRSVAGSGGTYDVAWMKIEDVRTFAGQTVTFSMWAKADTTRTVTASLTQGFGTGGSADVSTSLGSMSLTTSWQRFTFTVALPSLTGKTIGTGSSLQVYLGYPINTTCTIDMWGIQLEAGSVATPFTTATGTVQGELAACQRYYVYDGKVGVNAYVGSGTNCWGLYQFPTTMRITPTMTQTGGATASQNTSATTFTQDTSNSNTFKMGLYFLAGASTTTTYLYRVVEWSAEL
jgi:hypothetical protein